MTTTAYQLEGVLYSFHAHRDLRGHLATWECMTCWTAGGTLEKDQRPTTG